MAVSRASRWLRDERSAPPLTPSLLTEARRGRPVVTTLTAGPGAARRALTAAMRASHVRAVVRGCGLGRSGRRGSRRRVCGPGVYRRRRRALRRRRGRVRGRSAGHSQAGAEPDSQRACSYRCADNDLAQTGLQRIRLLAVEGDPGPRRLAVDSGCLQRRSASGMKRLPTCESAQFGAQICLP